MKPKTYLTLHFHIMQTEFMFVLFHYQNYSLMTLRLCFYHVIELLLLRNNKLLQKEREKEEK